MIKTALTIYSASTQYIRVGASADNQGVPVDPTAGSVYFAFVANNESAPASGDWNQGGWVSHDGDYQARLLVGPNGLSLDPGFYTIWIKVDLSPESVVAPVSELCIA